MMHMESVMTDSAFQCVTRSDKVFRRRKFVRDIQFEIGNGVLERFPMVKVYALRACGVVRALDQIDTATLLRQSVEPLVHSDDITADHPVIAAWRAAYARMGVKPSRHRSSIEALARRAVKGGDIASPLPAVDLYNACSLSAWAPVGAYDAARLPSGFVRLRDVQPETDRFEPLGAEASAFPLTSGLVVYADGDHALCWGFNVRDSRVSALVDASDDVVFFSEAVQPDQDALSEHALQQIRTILETGGATCSPVARANRDARYFALPIL
jgi:DNA/RNA-binding domain of Phe-tRNA-synthetase-like protein